MSVHLSAVVRLGRSFLLLVGVIGLLPQVALGQEACDRFFPDWNCPERQARPEGTSMPMSFPYIFEDPYIATGLNLVGIWHAFPNESVAGGGEIGVVALQARLAITERLAFIATKDGIGIFEPENPILEDDTDFFNISAGFKYAAWIWEGEGASAIVTPSLRYEAPVGSSDILQGGGDGLMIPALSSAYQRDDWHIIFGIGGHAPIDHDKNGSNVFYNLHIDHAFPVESSIVDFIVPFIELNGIHYVDSGDGSRNVKTTLGSIPIDAATTALGLSPFEGVDVMNLGSQGMAGEDFVTMAWGLRAPMDCGIHFGISYERPLSEREDLFEQRVTVMLTWEL